MDCWPLTAALSNHQIRSNIESHLLQALLLCTGGCYLWWLTRYQIHWDEFYYLAQIHQFVNFGEARSLQSLHVHLFPWLTQMAANEVDQVNLGRGMMLIALSISGWALYQLARHYLDSKASLFALICWLSVSYVLNSAAQFRVDPLLCALISSAYSLLICRPYHRSTHLGAPILVAIALMLSIKSLLLLPALALLQWGAHHSKAVAITRLLLSTTLTLTLFSIMLMLHQGVSSPPEISGVAPGATGTLSSALQYTLLNLQWFPRFGYFKQLLLDNPALVFAASIGLISLIKSRPACLKGQSANQTPTLGLALIALSLPLLSLLFYRNAYPYFYPLLLIPLSLLAGLGWQWLSHSRIRRFRYLLLLFILPTLFQFGLMKPQWHNQTEQRQLLSVIHQLFPEPVAYLDRSGMIASFPKVGPFLSSWTLTKYHSNQHPVLREAILKHQPPLYLVNTPVLDLDHQIYPNWGAKLIEEDQKALRAHYLPLWGPLYVAGKQLVLTEQAQQIQLVIGGQYQLMGPGLVLLDQQRFAAGDMVTLAPGHYRLKAFVPGTYQLRWQGLQPPHHSPPLSPLFSGF